jgi:hypothetical protein
MADNLMTHVLCQRCKRTASAKDSEMLGWSVRKVQGEYYGTDSDGEPLYVQWLEVLCPECQKGVR